MKTRDVAYGALRAGMAAIGSAMRLVNQDQTLAPTPELTAAEAEDIERQLLVATNECTKAMRLLTEAQGPAKARAA